jgi:quaternary ammonium compound-resistance protein SugE
MLASLGVLYWSMRSLPLGVAYPIWTGIGSVGSVVVGVTLFKQDIGVFGIAGVACLIIGMFLVSLETH